MLDPRITKLADVLVNYSCAVRHGTTIVVYLEAVWYGFVKLEDVDEILDSHLVGNKPVERLRLPPECINTERCRHKGGGTVQIGLGR